MKRRDFYTGFGAAAALCVPALVVAQSVSFGSGEVLTAGKLTDLAEGADTARAARCRVATRHSESVGGDCPGNVCEAVCPDGHVVMGGGCSLDSDNTLKRGVPAVAPGSGGVGRVNGNLADPITQFGDPVAASLGVINDSTSSPIWDRYICEAHDDGVVSITYAICCPL